MFAPSLSPPLARGFLTTKPPGMPEARLTIVLFLVRFPSPQTEDDPMPYQLPIHQGPFNSLWALKMTIPCWSHPNHWYHFPWHGPATPALSQLSMDTGKLSAYLGLWSLCSRQKPRSEGHLRDGEGGTQSFTRMPEPFVLSTKKDTWVKFWVDRVSLNSCYNSIVL